MTTDYNYNSFKKALTEGVPNILPHKIDFAFTKFLNYIGEYLTKDIFDEMIYLFIYLRSAINNQGWETILEIYGKARSEKFTDT